MWTRARGMAGITSDIIAYGATQMSIKIPLLVLLLPFVRWGMYGGWITVVTTTTTTTSRG